MSVVSKNPFDLLGDDGDSSPAPAPEPKAKKADTAAAAPAATPKAVPGSAPRGGAATGGGGGGRGAGRYPARGGPRNVYRSDGEQRNAGPTSSEGVAEGFETPGGFDGERIPNPRKGNHVRDAHTKGPRGNRPARNPTSGGHSARGGAGGGRAPAQGGERRQFERRSGGLPDSQKKVDQGWGANEGTAELTAEVEGEKDAVAEENTPQTPAAAEGDDGGWGAPDAAEVAAAAQPEEPAEPEEVQKSLDDFLAERAAAALAIGKKEGRTVNAETLEGTAFRREAIDEFFAGKEKAAAKAKTSAKKEKVYIEVDGTFATPPGGGRPSRGSGERGERGGRGGRGGFGGRGRGDFRGGAAGAGGAGRGRGGPRGGRAGGAPINASDEAAFPALGA